MIVPVVRGSVVPIRAADDREGVEVSMLKILNDRRLHLGVFGHSSGSAIIIGAMAELLSKLAVRVLAIGNLLCNFSVLLGVTSPRKIRPGHPAYGGVKVAGLAGAKVTAGEILAVLLNEQIPADGADVSGVALLEVEVGELVAGVGYKDGAEFSVDVLEVAASSKIRHARSQPSGVGSSDIEVGPNAAVSVD